MKKNPYFLVVLFFLTLTSCSKFGPEQDQAWELIDKGALIIDVRSKEEFNQGHLDNAINIEYDNIIKLSKRIKENKGGQVVLYCRSGRRASVALSELSKQGFINIYNAGGLNSMRASFENRLKK